MEDRDNETTSAQTKTRVAAVSAARRAHDVRNDIFLHSVHMLIDERTKKKDTRFRCGKVQRKPTDRTIRFIQSVISLCDHEWRDHIHQRCKQTYKQTDSRPHSHKLMYEFDVKHIVFNEWGNHSTDTDWPVGVPILQHTVFAAGEEVVGFRLKAHTCHTVFVGYQWSVSER